MKNVIKMLLGLSLVITFCSFAPSPSPCTEGHATAVARQELSACMDNFSHQLDYTWTATQNVNGEWVVSVIGQPRCHPRPGFICLDYFIHVGTVVVDANCNAVSVNCGIIQLP